MQSRGASRDTRWALGWLVGVVVGASALLVVLVGPLHIATGGTGHVAAVLAFVGVLVTAAASIIGLTVTRQSGRAAENRLRLDAAMRAGESFSSSSSGPVSSASVASSLLALTKLDNVDLAVALLVDFWLPGVEETYQTRRQSWLLMPRSDQGSRTRSLWRLKCYAGILCT
jgi:hypothetical protein